MIQLSRREREIQEVRQQIIHESWKIIVEEGWQALSIRKIADAIEYSVPVIYKHFENKEAILEHFTLEGYHILSRHIREHVAHIELPDVRLRAIGEAYWGFAAQHTAHYRLMFGLGIPHCEAINNHTEMKEISNYMLEAINEILDRANNQKVDRHDSLKAFWSTLHGYIAIELLSKDSISTEVPTLVGHMIEGLIFTLNNNK